MVISKILMHLLVCF